MAAVGDAASAGRPLAVLLPCLAAALVKSGAPPPPFPPPRSAAHNSALALTRARSASQIWRIVASPSASYTGALTNMANAHKLAYSQLHALTRRVHGRTPSVGIAERAQVVEPLTVWDELALLEHGRL